MKTVLFLMALVATMTAQASDVPPEKKIIQFHGEVTELVSMSQLAEMRKIKPYIQIMVDTCKKLRDGDAECEISGTKPIAATVKAIWGMDNKSIIPLSENVAVGDYVDTEEHFMVESARIVKVLDKNICRWTFALKLVGGQRIECDYDKSEGWEESISIMMRYPLKHVEVVAQ